MAASTMRELRDRWVDARWQSPLVRERGRFVLRSLARRQGPFRYRLRSEDVVVFIRHGFTDAFICHEVFRDPFYRPPPQVRSALPPSTAPISVLDLGGNVGMFGLMIRSLYPHARITAFEPDPRNAAILRRVIDANAAEHWDVVEACAAPAAGELPFVSGEGGLSRVPETDGAATATVPALDVFEHLGGADLLKMDIEGGEWPILADPRFGELAPAAVLLEWHSYHCPADNPRRHAAATMQALGYEITHERPPDVPDESPLYGAGALWAWKTPPGPSA